MHTLGWCNVAHIIIICDYRVNVVATYSTICAAVESRRAFHCFARVKFNSNNTYGVEESWVQAGALIRQDSKFQMQVKLLTIAQKNMEASWSDTILPAACYTGVLRDDECDLTKGTHQHPARVFHIMFGDSDWCHSEYTTKLFVVGRNISYRRQFHFLANLALSTLDSLDAFAKCQIENAAISSAVMTVWAVRLQRTSRFFRKRKFLMFTVQC
jgi:hypothetical protein